MVDAKMPKPMTAEEYVNQRLDDQIAWYDGKSGLHKRLFQRIRLIEVLAAAAIPFLAGFVSGSRLWPVYVSGALGVLITICAGSVALLQLQEHWIEYRTTAESLKKERYLFLTRVEPYDGEDAFEVLVQRVETLISKENTNWAQYMMKPEKEKAHG